MVIGAKGEKRGSQAEDKRSRVIKFWGHVIVLSCGAVDPGQAFDLIFEFNISNQFVDDM